MLLYSIISHCAFYNKPSAFYALLMFKARCTTEKCGLRVYRTFSTVAYKKCQEVAWNPLEIASCSFLGDKQFCSAQQNRSGVNKYDWHSLKYMFVDQYAAWRIA